jgi:hypothetical protein
VDLVALLQQHLGQVGAVLARNPGDQSHLLLGNFSLKDTKGKLVIVTQITRLHTEGGLLSLTTWWMVDGGDTTDVESGWPFTLHGKVCFRTAFSCSCNLSLGLFVTVLGQTLFRFPLM